MLDQGAQHAQNYNLTLNWDKCVFSAPAIKYVDFCQTADGLTPLNFNVEAVLLLPEPFGQTQLAPFSRIVDRGHCKQGSAPYSENLQPFLLNDVTSQKDSSPLLLPPIKDTCSAASPHHIYWTGELKADLQLASDRKRTVISGQSPGIAGAVESADPEAMSAGLEIVGIALGVIGWVISIVSCALPMWRVTAFIGSNIVTAQVIWEGLWMSCVTQSTGQMQCKVYDSMLALAQDLQAARALTVIAIILAVLAVLISIVGAKCTNCIEDEASKAKVMIIAGIFFIIAGVMTLIPMCWTAHTIIRDFYNPLLTDAQRRELGAALYIGWAASALLIIGGAMLCCSCPPKEKRYNPSRMAYSAPRSAGGAGYDRKDYV
ncbi:hypothetical protein GJAV_G00139320 [Gymnothorax javanicus]|nr:hypothetical protein GJAV_G00139320 [Gymnothorax javanicus]